MEYKRTLVIGDIHGSIDALESALKAAHYSPSEDRIICLGDYIDGWKYSYEVVDKLIALQAASPFENIYLKGNHEEWFLEVLNQNFEQFRVDRFITTKYRDWMLSGGLSTYLSYAQRSDAEILRHKTAFFDKLKLYHIENQKLFVHAGFDYQMGFEASLQFYPESLLWDRTLFRKVVQLWNLEQEGAWVDKKVTKIDQFEKIYIGHTPTIKYNWSIPQKMGNVINLDQGCKTTGVLSIWIEEQDVFFQNK
ncbi:metallophosphoesterase family protein [Aureispira sp. CCB-QB1]|uniref:metallophosphoesterase family protein n=1 Tax=Aureispira sp. CCB-QB1 TaxID=1313421 RepID=UPI0006970154|nr:metallophosphoesterase family protein [Aureispira sp. CCB-QB1]